MDEFARYAMLLDFYGPLLTERQNEIMDLHFNNDLSLVEIAEITGISRQGVFDAIKKGKITLDKYEGLLGLAGRFAEQSAILTDVMHSLDKLDAPEITDIRKRMIELYKD
jgi:predicted DNA-binding protein YlxM (UPF0122 family)